MNIKELKKELRLTNADIAKFFGLKPKAYYYSSARKRYEESLIRIYEFLKIGEKKESTKPGMNYTACYQQPFVSIFNSDCLELLSSIESETVDMVFADPPFNVRIKYKGYKDSNLNYKEWCEQWIAECFRVLKPTGTFYLMTIDRHLEWKMPIMAKYGTFINLVK